VAAEHCAALCDGRFPGQAKQTSLVEKEGKPCYYIIQFEPEGWALVAADDRATPVLGYSDSGFFYEDGQPPAMRGWLDAYAEEIRSLDAYPGLRRHARWDQPSLQTRAGGKIEPFIQVKWDQTAPYNKYCPENVKGEKAIVGCVAVALAQAMSVYRQPARPTGRKGYTDDDFGLVSVNFDREEPYDWDAILSGANGNDEAARLLYHCGVVVNMDYGKDASGAYTSRVPAALRDFFGYPASVARYQKRRSYTGDWIACIAAELAAGRPVIYDGEDDKGTSAHAFNLDGFDGAASFHVNWGWRGKNNGYFTLENLNDGKFNYMNNHGAVTGFDFFATDAAEAPDLRPPVRLSAGAGGTWILDADGAGHYEVCNMAGSVLARGDFRPGTQTLRLPEATVASVYVVSFVCGEERMTRKLMVHPQ
jgi:hypothetical protein